MSRKVSQIVPALALAGLTLVWIAPRVAGQATQTGMPSPKNGDWPVFTASLDGSKSMPLDLKQGVTYGKFNPKTLKYEQSQIDLTKGEVGWHSAPTVAGDTVIIGSSMAEGIGYTHSDNAKGLVRAFDVKTGRQIWRFNTM